MSVDLGPVNVLGADAVGRPGQRRFRLFAQNTRSSAVMWLEKQQLDGLAVAIDRSLALVTEGQVLRTEAQTGERSLVEGMPETFPITPGYEFQVGQMRLNFNEEDFSFLLSIIPLDIFIEGDREPQVLMNEEHAVSFIFSQAQAQNLSHSIISLLSSGRPVCPLCHTPLDDGPHSCVKQNGHHKIIQIEEAEE